MKINFDELMESIRDTGSALESCKILSVDYDDAMLIINDRGVDIRQIRKDNKDRIFKFKHGASLTAIIESLYNVGSAKITAENLSVDLSVVKLAMKNEGITFAALKKCFKSEPLNESFFKLKNSKRMCIEKCDLYVLHALNEGIGDRKLAIQLDMPRKYFRDLVGRLDHTLSSIRLLNARKFNQLVSSPPFVILPNGNSISVNPNDLHVVESVISTLSLVKTAKKLGRTDERVRQIVKKYEVSIRQLKADCEMKAYKLYENGTTISEIASTIEAFSEADVEKIILKLEPKELKYPQLSVEKKAAINEDILKSNWSGYQNIADKHGVTRTTVYKIASRYRLSRMSKTKISEILNRLAEGDDWETLKEDERLDSHIITLMLRDHPIITVEHTEDIARAAVQEHIDGSHQYEVCARYGLTYPKFLEFRKRYGDTPKARLSEEKITEYLDLIDAKKITVKKVAKIENLNPLTVYRWKLKYRESSIKKKNFSVSKQDKVQAVEDWKSGKRTYRQIMEDLNVSNGAFDYWKLCYEAGTL